MIARPRSVLFCSVPVDEIAAVLHDHVARPVERVLEDDDIEQPGGILEREEARTLARARPWASARVRAHRRRSRASRRAARAGRAPTSPRARRDRRARDRADGRSARARATSSSRREPPSQRPAAGVARILGRSRTVPGRAQHVITGTPLARETALSSGSSASISSRVGGRSSFGHTEAVERADADERLGRSGGSARVRRRKSARSRKGRTSRSAAIASSRRCGHLVDVVEPTRIAAPVVLDRVVAHSTRSRAAPGSRCRARARR